MHGLAVTVLVDSGSSASFIAATVAAQLPQLQRTPLEASVKVANGQILYCTSALLGCTFALGECQFQHGLRILPLESYDLILGIDWLELYSPMEVHWRSKWLCLYLTKEKPWCLQGLTAASETDIVIQL